jgi:hypothetical protein
MPERKLLKIDANQLSRIAVVCMSGQPNYAALVPIKKWQHGAIEKQIKRLLSWHLLIIGSASVSKAVSLHSRNRFLRTRILRVFILSSSPLC